MSKHLSLWDADNRLEEISAAGDPLVHLDATVDFERFRPILETAAGRPRGAKGGHPTGEIWPDAPAKASQKDTDARWTVKHKKAKAKPDGRKPVDIAIPVCGYKTHISIDKKHGIIRRRTVTDAAANDGKRLRGFDRPGNTCRDVWGDTAYRSAENERWLKENGLNSRIRRKKPRGRPMSARTAKANGRKSKDRAKVEHVFAHQKARMGLTIRTVGLARAKAAVTMANMAYNMGRLRWLPGRAKTACA